MNINVNIATMTTPALLSLRKALHESQNTLTHLGSPRNVITDLAIYGVALEVLLRETGRPRNASYTTKLFRDVSETQYTKVPEVDFEDTRHVDLLSTDEIFKATEKLVDSNPHHPAMRGANFLLASRMKRPMVAR